MSNETSFSHTGLTVPTDTTGIIAAVSFAAVLCGGLVKVFMYARRLCQGKDVISDCIVGGKKVRIEIDGNGDGKIEASEKLVLDLDKRSVEVVPTGNPSPSYTKVVPNPVLRRRNSPQNHDEAQKQESRLGSTASSDPAPPSELQEKDKGRDVDYGGEDTAKP